ncbi:M56 family metallopeptidase [candidate division KSB1 bacterium]|nr:M56 family metallopeptidase [candidate division KSB1 bacterium]
MTVFFDFFVTALLQNTIFIVIVLFVLLLLKGASARIKYNIALLGLIKLLIPPFLPVAEFSLLNFFAPDVSSQNIQIGPMVALLTNNTEAKPVFNYSIWVLLAWFFFFMIFIIVPLIKTYELKKLLRSSIPLDTKTLPCNPVNIKFYECCNLGLPLSMGILYPKIFLPSAWKTWSVEQTKAVLEHEKTHIERKDALAKSLQIVVQAIYFYHPFVWILNGLTTDYREMACDDNAIAKSRTTPVQYSRILVTLAEKIAHSQLGYTPASALIKQKSNLRKRVNYQIKEKKNMKIKILFFIVVIFGAGLMLSTYCTKERPVDAGTAVDQNDTSELNAVDDNLPQPVGGYIAIMQNLKYPEIARKAGVEGRVLIEVTIDEYGAVSETKVIKSLGNNGCDEAAVRAIKSTKWKSASKDGKPVRSTVAIPILFRLSNEKDAVTTVVASNEEVVAYDSAPEPIGGYPAMQKNLIYPEAARKAGVEGRVYVQVTIDENGEVTKTQIVKSLGNTGCDEAAIQAITSTKWKPALQDGKPVKVSVGIPIVFKLK